MLIQAAQHLPRTPGPLGAFFRRIARRKGHCIAVVAAARKLAEIAFLMLKNGEPYRFASPLAARAKLSRLRVAATGERRVAKPALGKSRPASYGSKVHVVNRPGLPQMYAAEGLPPIRTLVDSPLGEQAMLRREGLTDAVAKLQRPHQRIRKDGRLLPEGEPPMKIEGESKPPADQELDGRFNALFEAEAPSSRGVVIGPGTAGTEGNRETEDEVTEEVMPSY